MCFYREKNLTEKYYAEKALRYVQHIHLKRKWEDYLALPIHKQLLETGLYHVYRCWCLVRVAFLVAWWVFCIFMGT